ncbi:MAG: ABC transporter ATP-binding protein [Rubrobacteraceae bacterium]
MYEQRSERNVISLKNLVKSYEGFTLGPLDLEVEPGYVVAIVGPNGSGKSTLFRMMMGLSQPDSGEIEIFGDRYPEGEVEIKRRIGYVPDISTGHDEMTAADLGSFVSHWYPKWNEELYANLLRRFEINAKKRFDKLSKGMQRRLTFTLAVARSPDLLLLDEPTDSVDPFARRIMLEEISTFLEAGERTVLFATHVMDEVRRVADYVAFLDGGHFLGFYEKDALLEQWKTL